MLAHRSFTLTKSPHLKITPNSRIKATRIKTSMALNIPKAGEIIVTNDPAESKLQELGVRSWGTWSCDVSVFPWTYDANETCYLLEGEVTVTPDGGSPVSFKKGDMVSFPSGMSCVWDVKKAVKKHFKFH